MLAGERSKSDPRGGLSEKEMFKAWEYARKNNLVEARIPNKALIYFALQEGVATTEDVEVKESDRGGTFRSLDDRIYYKAIDRLNEVYDFKILRDTYEENNPETAKENNADGIENNQPTQKQDNETTTESASGEQSHERSGEQDESTESVATDVEGGVALGDVMDEDEIDYEESDADSSSEDSGADDDGDDGTTRFQTYEKPDSDLDDIDVDKNAVTQFADEYLVVDPNAKDELKVHKKQVFNAFATWAKLNELPLDELSEETYINHRKGALNRILKNKYDITEGRYTVNGERTDGFSGIALSDIGEELLGMDMD